MLTNSTAKSSIVKVIRNKLKGMVTEIVEKNKYDDIFDGVISYKIQREIRAVINKILPLKACEVKALKEEKEKIKTAVKKEEKKETKEAPKKVVPTKSEPQAKPKAIEEDEQTKKQMLNEQKSGKKGQPFAK